MRKVVIVDDEYIIAQGLSQIIGWKDFDMRVVGTATNGTAALDLIRRTKPDLVFTDIRMPGMSGLDLIREARAYVPKTVFVIISGFNDFEYIRSALRLNVFDYLDKPITVEKMQHLLLRFNEYIQESARKNRQDVVRRCLSKYLDLCLISDSVSKEQIRSIWKEQNLSVPDCGFFMSIVANCRERNGFSCFEKELSSLLRYHMLRMITLKRHGFGVYLIYSDEPFPEYEDLVLRIQSILDAITERGISFYAGISKRYSSVYETGSMVNEAKRAANQAEFFNEHYLEVNDPECGSDLPLDIDAAEQSIALAMRIGDKDTVCRVVSSVLNGMTRSSITMELYYHESLSLVYLALRVLRDTGVAYNLSPEPPHVEIQRYRSIGELQRWVINWFDRCLDLILAQNQGTGKKNVAKAKRYIDSHYNQPITLEQLAAICDMNPTYFSVLFKSQVGQTYVKYLGQVRMEQAKILLLSGMPVHKVSEQVGFTSQRYFSDRFKAYWGCTPTQIRDQETSGKESEHDINQT